MKYHEVSNDIIEYFEKAFLREERSKHNFKLQLQTIFEINIVRNDITPIFANFEFNTTELDGNDLSEYKIGYSDVINDFGFGYIKKCEYMKKSNQKIKFFDFDFCSN